MAMLDVKKQAAVKTMLQLSDATLIKNFSESKLKGKQKVEHSHVFDGIYCTLYKEGTHDSTRSPYADEQLSAQVRLKHFQVGSKAANDTYIGVINKKRIKEHA
jgi:hypothetical protein